MKFKRILVSLLCTMLVLFAGCSALSNNIHDAFTGGELEVHFIDVGQADATLVISDGETMLIDGGNAADSNLIYSYLEAHDVTHIDYMICTHAHEDHVGGLAGALNYATVGTVYCPTDSGDTQVFNNFVKYLDTQNASITIPEVSTEFMLGKAECTIIGVNNGSYGDTNNSSIVMKMVYGDTSFLFSGDAEQSVEKSILDDGYDVSCTVMKVPHHGSELSMSYRWIREADPKYAVISCGTGNQYGHPREEVLSKLEDAEITTLRTDMQGDIICTSDGKKVKFQVSRNADADTLSNAGNSSRGGITANSNSSSSAQDSTDISSAEASYVLNNNTMKFHHPDCRCVRQMNERNKTYINENRGRLIGRGYSPCGNCNP